LRGSPSVCSDPSTQAGAAAAAPASVPSTRRPRRATVRTIAAVLTACLLAAGANADVAGDFPASNTPSEYHLTDSPTSIRDLMDKFRHALETKDKQLLRALRVTQDEYLGIIMPGSVEERQPRRAYSQQAHK